MNIPRSTARHLAAVTFLVALGATACGGGSTSTPSSGGYGRPSAATSGSGRGDLAVRQTSLGRILTDSAGRTLYLFERDRGTTSSCYGGCAAAWPPLLTSGRPAAGAGVTKGLVGTSPRRDGTTEVTYHGHPLYHYSGDQRPGQTNGEGSTAFGGGWYVVSPGGTKIDNS